MSTIVLSENFPPKVGGSGRWFWELYRRLPREDFLIVAGSDPAGDAFDAQHDLRLQRIPLTFSSRLLRPGSFSEYRRAYRLLRTLVETEGPTQLHCGRWLPEGLLAWWLKRRTGVPYVCFAHGEEVNCLAGTGGLGGQRSVPTVYGSRELGIMASLVLRGSRALIANSDNTRTILINGWGLDPASVFCLYPGVDVDRFRPAEPDANPKSDLGWSGRLVLLTVGRLQKRKGQAMMIEALPLLLSGYPNLLYVVVGSGEESERLRRLTTRLGLGSNVEFRPDVGDAELVQCYQGCDLFVLPNRAVGADIEGFGMVLLEAQACGKAVVAGLSGGTKEAIIPGRSGVLIDCTAPEAVAEGLRALLADRDRRAEMGSAGRHWVVEKFSWQALRDQAIRLFREVQE